MIVILHLLPQPTVFTALVREVDALLDKVPSVTTVQNEGDFVGDLEIEGLNVVDGFDVGTKVGNFDGTLLGEAVGLWPKAAKDLTVPSLHTRISLKIKVEFRVANVLDPI